MMIQAEVYRNKDNEIIKVFISGHSGYDVIGKDIICSAVSTAMFMTIGLLEKIACDYRYVADEAIPTMKLNIYKSDDLIQTIMENLVDTLSGITIDYAQYLKISEIRR